MPKNKPVFSFMWEGVAVGVNDRYLYRTSKVLNPAYAGFMADIALRCLVDNPWPASNPIDKKLFIRWTQVISAGRDADSLIKPLFDGIEKSGVITNDNKLRNGSWITIDKKRGQFDRITVSAYLLEDQE